MISACGVICSRCPAYRGAAKGSAHQKRTAAAWRKIYRFNEKAENITCSGCLGPDDEVFHSSLKCKARTCCISKGFKTCAACPEVKCPLLEKAQSVWDGVPDLARKLSHEDFVMYAEPYCDHRRRLEGQRGEYRKSAAQ